MLHGFKFVLCQHEDFSSRIDLQIQRHLNLDIVKLKGFIQIPRTINYLKSHAMLLAVCINMQLTNKTSAMIDKCMHVYATNFL